ncbi:MAG: transcription termination/antitermination protein NusG [Terriglobia bacterium]
MQNLITSEYSLSPEPDARWHALYTRHQHEKMVGDMLAGKGFDIFLPLYESTRRWKDRLKTLSLPLFPCYVFVHGGMERQLQLLTTPGVHSIVAAGGRAAVIPCEEIEAVRRAVENPVHAEPHPFLKCGDWVRVKAGPLEGAEGILVRWKGAFRLVLSVEMLQKSVAVEVDASVVERAPRRERIGITPATGNDFAYSALIHPSQSRL